MAEFSSSNVKNSELVLGSPNNNNNNNSNSECDSIFRNQSMARRKFEKFRTKLVELFFTTTTTTTSINVLPKSPSSSLVNTSQNNNDLSNDDESSLSLKNHKQQQSKRRKSSSSTSCNCIEPASNTMLISNCYYGYKTIQMGNESGEEFVSNMNRKTSKKTKGTTSKHSINTYVTQSFSSSTDSSSTSSITDENESNSCSSYRNSSKHTGEANFSPCQVANSNSMSGSFHKPSGMIMIDSNYDSFSMNTNSFDFYQNETHCASSPIEAAQNPFLNASLTDLISFNSELSLLESFFEASLHLIDDQDNFFDIDFMTNYISYILLKQIKTSSNFLKQNGYDLRMATSDPHQNNNNDKHNLLKKIAREIYLQSETEPCGLKGCKMSIYFEETEEINHLLSQFRFDSTSSLTTFELSLIIKKDYTSSSSTLTGLTSTKSNINCRNQSESKVLASSPFATLTRRILNRNKTKTVDDETVNAHVNEKDVYLNPNDYVLLKLKLY